MKTRSALQSAFLVLTFFFPLATYPTDQGRHFDEAIAPLLARHCVECHGPESKKGRLDLSNKQGAFAGGKQGKAIVAGNTSESLLWEYVESDEMPDERPPLSPEEKRLLREWIEQGAVWSANENAPIDYLEHRQEKLTWVRRLTVPEYIETVRRAVGVDIEEDARRILPPDLRADGFNNTAYNLTVGLGHIRGYARLAEIIVGRMDVGSFAARFSECAELNQDCMRELVSEIGRWVLRAPPREHEITSFLNISKTVAKRGGEFPEAVRLILEAMLQSPRFIYRMEDEQGGSDPGYVLASRLSYILWGGPPDEELFRAAAAGELADHAKVRAQVERMLNDSRAIERSSRFVYEWLNLGRLGNLRPNPDKFPNWDTALADDMREETLAFFTEVTWEQDRPLTDLLDAEFTFASPRLAAHYGLKQAPHPGISSEWAGRATAERVSEGLRVLYTFQDGNGSTIRDVSDTGEALGLEIDAPAAVEWGAGWLRVKDTVLISRAAPPKGLIAALKKSRAVTLEAWITPANDEQAGPARILTLSSGSSQRNFTVGQDGDKIEVRFRTTETSANGLPGLTSKPGSLQARLTHLVYTRAADGEARLYLNGQSAAEFEVKGGLGNWEDGFRLALANETSKDRLWQGAFHLVAVYDRALSKDEVRQNYQVGPREKAQPFLAGAERGTEQVEGLEALYTFQENAGETINNVAPDGDGLDLRIEDSSAVGWESGGLRMDGSPKITTSSAPTRLIEAIRKSESMTLEAWITPDNSSQSGPARIVTLSSGTGARNFTLGQDGDKFQVRFRTSATDANGLPGLSSASGSASPRLTHIIYTRSAQGITRLYVDGQEVANGETSGSLEPWSHDFKLAFGNETTGDRPWKGTLHLVAIYSRALTPDEVRYRGSGLARYDLASVPGRRGLLTQGSVLTVGGDEASMVARGLFLLHDILDGKVADPPPCVDTTPVPTEPGLSQRAIAMQRLSNQACTACHSKFEPLAFGLEKFDGLGAYHELDEHGNKLRDDGEILFPGKDEPVAYDNSKEMADLLAGSDRVRQVITQKVIQFALGRPLLEADLPAVREINEAAQEGGGTYASLITAIVLSDLVQNTNRETLGKEGT